MAKRARAGRVRRRRSGVLPTVGLIVEGDTEYYALPLLAKNLPGCPPLKPVNLKGVGSDVSSAAIAKMVAPKVAQHWLAGRSKVVVCIDRESRQQCAAGLAKEVADALVIEIQRFPNARGSLSVVIVDRAFEAWILADAKGLFARGVLANAPSFHCFEGRDGEQAGKGVVELSRLLGRPYNKVVDGSQLFMRIDIGAARSFASGGSGSRSFDKFLRCLGV